MSRTELTRPPLGHDDLLLWALVEPLTPMRLAALGAAGFIALCRDQARTLPRRANRERLREMALTAGALGHALRIWADDPQTAEGRRCSADAADICARWPWQAMAVHRMFQPRLAVPPRHAEAGRDAYGFPLGPPTPGWPKPSRIVPFPTLDPWPTWPAA
jgi:hypothetical protein